MTIRVGIVGTGENARDHARACRKVSQAELVAICDISEAALERFGIEFGVSRRYTALEEMLADHSLDLVIISTWGVHHARVSNAVARSGNVRAILCEKPISMNAQECAEMIAVAREHNVLLTEAFKFRYHPQFRRVQEVIESGRIGEVKAVQAFLTTPLVRYLSPTNWRYHRERGGGSVFDTASYLIHIARFVLNAEPVEVYATGSYIEGADVEVSAAIQLRFPGNANASLVSSYQYGYCQSTVILGTRGWIRMEAPIDQRSVREKEFVTKEDLPAVVQVFYDNFDTETYQFAPANQFELQMAYLCQGLASGRAPMVSPEFSLGNMRTIDAVYESIRTGQPVTL